MRHPDVKPAPNQAPASGKKRTYTLEVLKRILLESIALTNSMISAEHQVMGYREAVLALPDRRLLRGLPMEARSFLERELDALEVVARHASRLYKPGCGLKPAASKVGRPASKAFLAALGKGSGRSTTGAAKVPYYVESPVREAVKHIRLTAARFLADRASLSDLDEAIRILDVTRRQVGR